MAQDKTGRSTYTHECRDCRSDLIQPTEWTRLESGWNIRVTCPECGAHYTLELDQDQVTELSYEMEAGFHALLEALDELDRDLFEEECDLFIAALVGGNILPMDF